MITPQQYIWRAAGSPAHSYTTATVDGKCSSCGGPLDGKGVQLSDVETSTMSAHADNFRYWSRHICDACAWLYGAGRGRPGNFIATDAGYEETVISLTSVVQSKRPWLTVLEEVATLDSDSPMTGVMTTDVKPRLWPRCRLATINRPGLYVHAPDYDVSGWVRFSLEEYRAASRAIIAALEAGYSKQRCYHGLFTDGKRALKDPATALRLDAAIGMHRGRAHFLPALIASGVIKGDRANAVASTRADRNTDTTAASGDQHHPTQPGLF